VRAIAVDWSGAARPAALRRSIWVAEAEDGALRSLTAGRTREETIGHVLDRVSRRPETVVGFDFAFSFPAWWLAACGAGGAPEMWDIAGRDGERWLAGCEAPFWGRPGRPRPLYAEGRTPWRRTEAAVPGRARPKSVFQIGGAGSVGTGSIRGMPFLRRLRAEGVAIWPFDDAEDGPVAAEVYPRWCTGPVVKSDPAARAAHLSAAWPGLPGPVAAQASGSEDAFDAACTALVMSVGRPPGGRADETDRREGRVFEPSTGGPGCHIEGRGTTRG
jgi:hypothetical protein